MENSNLEKDGENLLQTNSVLEVHPSIIVDMHQVQFIDDDAENLVPTTLEPVITPTTSNTWEDLEQLNQETSTKSDTILEKLKRVIKKPARLIEEKELRNYCVEELTCYIVSVADEVESFEPITYKEAINCSAAQWFSTMGEEMLLFTRTECGNS